MQYIQRKIHAELVNHLKNKDMSLILGPRQAGKTTLMLRVQNELKKKNIPTMYFSLDLLENKQYFKTQHALIGMIQKSIGDKKAVVFIDEIQRLENAGVFLKGLYDLDTGHKFIVSGSGSLELRANIIEPLTGRKKIFYCPTLTFSEFAANKLKVSLDELPTSLDINSYETQRLVNEYILFGGYPKVVLSKTIAEKIEALKEIFQSYIERDIQLLINENKDITFQNLVKVLSSQVGCLLNYSELSSDLGIEQKTVKKYIYLLQKTFVINLVYPYFRNTRTEVKKSPKIYFVDLGLLNFMRKTIFQENFIDGGLFENASFLRLKELESFDDIKFWRSLSAAEVDFIMISPKNGQPIPIEVKLGGINKEHLSKSLISFIKKYKPSEVFVYTKEKEGTFNRFEAKINTIPYHKLPDI